MYQCYHTTKISNLKSILQNGLQPIYGDSYTSDAITPEQLRVCTIQMKRRKYS